MPDTQIPMGMAGPLREGIIGFLLGCSLLSLVPGVVDSDYIGDIKF